MLTDLVAICFLDTRLDSEIQKALGCATLAPKIMEKFSIIQDFDPRLLSAAVGICFTTSNPTECEPFCLLL